MVQRLDALIDAHTEGDVIVIHGLYEPDDAGCVHFFSHASLAGEALAADQPRNQ